MLMVPHPLAISRVSLGFGLMPLSCAIASNNMRGCDDGYSNTPGLWVDSDGDYHINEVEANAPDDNIMPTVYPEDNTNPGFIYGGGP
jgi:hypothetical protein